MVIGQDAAAAAALQNAMAEVEGGEEGGGGELEKQQREKMEGTSPALSAPWRSSPICHPAQYLFGWQS
ncbi:hypothetical protein EYF80_053332 [Liparis tanakae]|uniref:Uncharacterized protein n=1 Tax=Liparis tanakae TaxID=230148 RepID=A0A4Z2F5R9_9TELE|nr:hypothetical protein EYF80_053332 [Liparis tanakae]